jgi:hypothetical protein
VVAGRTRKGDRILLIPLSFSLSAKLHNRSKRPVESIDPETPSEKECDEYVVTLRFFGDDLDPDEVTRLIGCAPTAAVRRGDQRPTRTGFRIERTGSWRLSSEQSATDMEEQLVTLLERLTPDLSVWQSLTTRFQADLFCGVFFSHSAGGLIFPPRLHRLLADRNLPLWLDIYASDERTENT